VLVFDVGGGRVGFVEEGGSFGGDFETAESEESLVEVGGEGGFLEEEVADLLDIGVQVHLAFSKLVVLLDRAHHVEVELHGLEGGDCRGLRDEEAQLRSRVEGTTHQVFYRSLEHRFDIFLQQVGAHQEGKHLSHLGCLKLHATILGILAAVAVEGPRISIKLSEPGFRGVLLEGSREGRQSGRAIESGSLVEHVSGEDIVDVVEVGDIRENFSHFLRYGCLQGLAFEQAESLGFGQNYVGYLTGGKLGCEPTS